MVGGRVRGQLEDVFRRRRANELLDESEVANVSARPAPRRPRNTDGADSLLAQKSAEIVAVLTTRAEHDRGVAGHSERGGGRLAPEPGVANEDAVDEGVGVDEVPA